MRSLLRYERGYKEKYSIRFVDGRIMHIAEDIMLSESLAANCRATYRRYIRVGKIMIKQRGVLSLLVKLGREAPAAKNVGLTHVDYQSLYISSVTEILLIIQATDALFKSDHKPA